jgi:UDP-N-acetylglucosamine/UDP-N-acetylgalactosamine diphosphorylase
MDVDALRTNLAKFGQEHVLDFWDELSDDEKHLLYSDVSSIHLQTLTDVFNRTMEASKTSGTKKDDRLEPFPEDKIAAVARSSPDQLDEWRSVGLRLISEGKVAVLLLAGGQGTRLGVDYPKGMYSVGLPSGKTLYQLQAERIKKLEELAEEREGQGKITWYIMTSEHTGEKTKEFFKDHNYFGLDRNNLVLFEQAMQPSLTHEGKLILDQKWKISRAPDGNGGDKL